jgi:hypothetical protein
MIFFTGSREIEVEVRLVLKRSLNQLEHLTHHPTCVAVQPALMALSARLAMTNGSSLSPPAPAYG